jgi:hypothetical protein
MKAVGIASEKYPPYYAVWISADRAFEMTKMCPNTPTITSVRLAADLHAAKQRRTA